MFSFSRVSLASATNAQHALAASNPVFRLAQLRSKTLKQASKFHDYNFRMYFIQKTVDTYNTVAKQPEDKIKEFCLSEGKEQYLQMKRMATLNATYARTPVFLDPAFASANNTSSSSSAATSSSTSNNEAALPRRAFATEDDEENPSAHHH